MVEEEQEAAAYVHIVLTLTFPVASLQARQKEAL